MTLRKRSWFVATGALTFAAGFIAALATAFVQPGCSNCGSNCPSGTVYIGTADNSVVSINNIVVTGPACPPQYGVYCLGDPSTTGCNHFTITGQTEGICDVQINFFDRPAEVIRLQFGPPITQGCCNGYTIIGDSTFIIPNNPDAGIYGADGGSQDAVRIIVDGAVSDGGDGAAGDGGAD